MASSVSLFSYPAWSCSGVLGFADIGTSFRPISDGQGRRVVGAKLKHVVLESGRTQRCGGSVKTGRSDPDQGWLIVRKAAGGKLRMDASLVWTPEAQEDEPNPERPITTTLDNWQSR